MVKRLALWSFLFSLSLVCALAVGELALRLYDSTKGITPPYAHNLPECLAVPNGYYNYGLEPNVDVMFDSDSPRSVSIDRWGFRSDGFDPIKPKGVKRIFCLGGSSTFDPYVGDDDTWSALLEKNLNVVLSDSVECINAGRYGYTSAEILGLLHHRILRFNPDLIILYSTYNDSRKVMSPYYGADDFPQLYGNSRLSWLNKHSALFAFFDFRLRHAWKWKWYISLVPSYSYKVDSPDEHFEFLNDAERAIDYNVAEFSRNLTAIKLLTQESGAALLLCTQMIDTTGADATPVYNRMITGLTSQIHEMTNRDSLTLLDFARTPRNDLLNTYVHFSPIGSEVFSDSLSNIILREGLLD